MIRKPSLLPYLLGLLVTLLLPLEASALIRQEPASGSFFASEWETCRNDPVNNSDPLGLDGGNVVSAYGLIGLEDGVYRNDFGYAQLARTEWDVQKRVAKDSAKVGATIGAGVLTAGASTEIMLAVGVARGSLALSVGAGMAAGFGSDAALQGTSILLGDQENFSGTELFSSTVVGGGLGAGGKYLGDFVGALASRLRTAAVGPSAGSLTHLTDPLAQTQILSSQRIGGQWGVFALESHQVPATQVGRVLKTMVASDLSAGVEVTGPAVQAFNKPPIYGPVSTLRRLAGIRSTPIGSVDLATGQFVPNEILSAGVFRQAKTSEIAAFRLHQFLLDYGYDTLIYGGAGAYWYLTQDPEAAP